MWSLPRTEQMQCYSWSLCSHWRGAGSWPPAWSPYPRRCWSQRWLETLGPRTICSQHPVAIPSTVPLCSEPKKLSPLNRTHQYLFIQFITYLGSVRDKTFPAELNIVGGNFGSGDIQLGDQRGLAQRDGGVLPQRVRRHRVVAHAGRRLEDRRGWRPPCWGRRRRASLRSGGRVCPGDSWRWRGCWCSLGCDCSPRRCGPHS